MQEAVGRPMQEAVGMPMQQAVGMPMQQVACLGMLEAVVRHCTALPVACLVMLEATVLARHRTALARGHQLGGHHTLRLQLLLV